MKVALQAVESALQLGHKQGLVLNHGDFTSIIDHLILDLSFSSSFKIACINSIHPIWVTEDLKSAREEIISKPSDTSRTSCVSNQWFDISPV
jgi:hypothetical protein